MQAPFNLAEPNLLLEQRAQKLSLDSEETDSLMEVCGELGLNVLGARAFGEGRVAHAPLPPRFATEGRGARMLQLYKSLNDETYPHWAGIAFAANTLEHLEDNLDCLRLPMSEEALVRKVFPKDKLTKLMHTGHYGDSKWSNTNRKVSIRRKVEGNNQ